MRLLRRELPAALATLLASSTLTLRSSPAIGAPLVAPSTLPSPAKVTDRIFLDVRIIQRYDIDVLEDAAIRGRLTFGLFGTEAPQATKKFLEFVDGTTGQFSKSGGGPAYSSSSFFKLKPGEAIEGGRINGLRLTDFAGQREYEYMSRLVPLRPLLEANSLRHDRRGLLTRAIFNAGPEFGVTLNAAPNLDGENEIFGQLESTADAGGGLTGGDVLELLEGLPYITGKSLEGDGTTANAIFTAQKSFFSSLAKASGDTRAEDRTGLLLRRVEITRCGRL